MHRALLAVALIAGALAACSSEPAPTNATANAGAEAPAANTAQAPVDNDARLARLAECSVAMEEVARTYEIFSRTRPAERDEMIQLATSRNAAAAGYAQQANEMARRMGRPSSAVDEMLQSSRQRVRQEYETVGEDNAAFENFLLARGREADTCVNELGEPTPA